MRYLNELEYSQPQSTYAGEAVQEVKGLNTAMSNEYEEAKKTKDTLDLYANNLDVRDVDYGIKKKTIEDLKAQFKDLVANGNYQDANFLVKDAAKKLAMDKNVQGALQSRAKELAYQKDLKDRLDKRDLNEETYLYKSKLSKEKNQTPLSYDENTGLYQGMYEGVDAFNDKSKEIYDLFNERGKGWMPTEMREVNGTRFKKIGGIAGGYINMETGKEVTENDLFNAFKTELRGRKDFADYLDQEKEIDTYKLTGGTNVVDKTILNKVMSEDEIQARLVGMTPNEFAKLKESKDAKAKSTVLEAKQKFENLDDKTIKGLYNDRYDQMQNAKYVSPSASKYSFEEFTDKQWENKPYLMDLDAAHKRRQAQFENDLKEVSKAPLPENKADIENMTGQEFIKQQEFIKGLDGKIANAKTALDLAVKTGNNEAIAQAQKNLNNLQHNKEDYTKSQATLINNLNPTTKNEILEDVYTNALNDESFVRKLTTDRRLSVAARTNLLMLLKEKAFIDANSSETGQASNFNFNKKLKEVVGNLKKEGIVLDDALKLTENKGNFLPTSTAAGEGGMVSFNSFKDKLNSKIADAIDEQSTVNMGNNSTVYGLDYNTDKGWERGVIDHVSSLIQTNPSGFSKNGITLDQIYSGTSGFTFENTDGDKVEKPDNSKTKIGFVTNNLNGDIQLKLTFYDSKNQPLTRKTKEGQTIASMNFTPEDQQGIAIAYETIGKNLLQSKDQTAVKQGLDIIGYTRHGQELSLFRPGQQKVGSTTNATIDFAGETKNLKFKILNETSEGNKNFQVFNEDGSPFNLPRLGSDKRDNTFGSKQEFFNNLALVEEYGR